jgi:hypothetical protein
LKQTVSDLTEVNKKLRKDLKESIAGQLFPLDLDSNLNDSNLINKNESAKNYLEKVKSFMEKSTKEEMGEWEKLTDKFA